MLKEIYNDNNLKVYADSDEYKVAIYRGHFTNYYTLTKNRIYDIVQGEVSKVRSCTITVQGTKLIIEGELEDGFINNYGLDTTLKGDINVRVESGHNMYSCVYNLYGNADIVLGEYNSPLPLPYIITQQLVQEKNLTQRFMPMITQQCLVMMTKTYTYWITLQTSIISKGFGRVLKW